MKTMGTNEITISRTSHDIVSADTSFYSFMGDRLYYTFDRFVCEEDREFFVKCLNDKDRQIFAVRLCDASGNKMCCLIRKADKSIDNNTDILKENIKHAEPENINLTIINAGEFIESHNELRKTLTERNMLLGLYDDDFFDYNPATGELAIYSMGQYQNKLADTTLEKLERRMHQKAAGDVHNEVDKFFSAIRNGERRAEINVNKNIISDDINISNTCIKACAIYDNGEYVRATGYIHVGIENRESARKRVNIDSLTGLISKADITNAAISLIDEKKVKGTAIAIADVDYFKRVNDTFGHKKGDDVLRKVADIIKKEVGQNGMVGRIGGDEFFIIFFDAENMENSRERLRSIKNIVTTTFPGDKEDEPAITLSIGCASYPKDADFYVDLFTLADFALYRAKEKGRNRYIIFDKEKHGTLDQIRKMKMTANRINSRGDMSMGDIMCVMMDKAYAGSGYPIEKLLDDLVVNFRIQRIIIYAGNPHHAVYMAGEKRPTDNVLAQTQDYVDDSVLNSFYKGNMMVMDDISIIAERSCEAYKKMKKQEILSLIQVKTKDRNGNEVILSLESVNTRVTWNKSWLHYYRLMGRILSAYEM